MLCRRDIDYRLFTIGIHLWVITIVSEISSITVTAVFISDSDAEKQDGTLIELLNPQQVYQPMYLLETAPTS